VQGCSSALLDKVEHKHKGQEKKENKINAGWKSKINNEKKTKQRKLKQKERKSGNLNGRKTCSRNYLKRGTGRQAVMNL
jgi:hypothetical protein